MQQVAAHRQKVNHCNNRTHITTKISHTSLTAQNEVRCEETEFCTRASQEHWLLTAWSNDWKWMKKDAAENQCK
jgi:hypothetical protein